MSPLVFNLLNSSQVKSPEDLKLKPPETASKDSNVPLSKEPLRETEPPMVFNSGKPSNVVNLSLSPMAKAPPMAVKSGKSISSKSEFLVMVKELPMDSNAEISRVSMLDSETAKEPVTLVKLAMLKEEIDCKKTFLASDNSFNLTSTASAFIRDNDRVGRGDTGGQTETFQSRQCGQGQRTDGSQLSQVEGAQNGAGIERKLTGNQLQVGSIKDRGLGSIVHVQVTVEASDTVQFNGAKSVTFDCDITDGSGTGSDRSDTSRIGGGEVIERTGLAYTWGCRGQSRI